jgi:hypothetical protein
MKPLRRLRRVVVSAFDGHPPSGGRSEATRDDATARLTTTGPHDTAAADEDWWPTVARLPDAAGRLDKVVDCSCRILARTQPIHAIIRGAADKEAFAAALSRRLLEERLTNQTDRIRRFLGHDLRPGLSVAEAGQRYCALASPELYHLLTVELGWSAKRHQTWLTELLKTELLREHAHRPVAGRR